MTTCSTRNEKVSQKRTCLYFTSAVSVSVSVSVSFDCVDIAPTYSYSNLNIRRFEDGTVNYLAILSLPHGFNTLQRLGGNMKLISTRVFSLAQHLHEKLLTLHHSNGNPAVKLYDDTDYSDYRTQGGVVNFNLLRSNSQYIGYTEVNLRFVIAPNLNYRWLYLFK